MMPFKWKKQRQRQKNVFTEGHWPFCNSSTIIFDRDGESRGLRNWFGVFLPFSKVGNWVD